MERALSLQTQHLSLYQLTIEPNTIYEKLYKSGKIKLPNDFALIQSSTKQTYTSNKDWSVNGMQGIIDHFRNINWIQIGKSVEPKLNNCEKLLDLNFILGSTLWYHF